MAPQKTDKKINWLGVPTRIIIVVLAVALVYQLITLNTKVQSAKSQQNALQQEVNVLQEENAALEADIARANDEEMLEDKARWEQNMVYPDEKVFIDSNSRN